MATFCALLAGVLVAGCCLEHPEVHPTFSDCTATIRDQQGRVEMATTLSGPFREGGRLVSLNCVHPIGEAAIPEYFQQRLRRVTETRPEFASRGPWCVERVHCAVSGPATFDETCPDLLGDTPVLAPCPSPSNCLLITPGPDPAAPGFESLVDLGTVASGGTSRRRVLVKNTCPVDVRLRLNPVPMGPAAGDFTVLFNTCQPTNPADVDGLLLPTQAQCSFSVDFRPTAAGPRGARLVVGHAMSMNQQVALRGVGDGGTLGAPGSLCVGGALTPTTSCPAGQSAAATLTLTNPGTRPVTVRRLTTRALTGTFVVTGRLLPFRVDPGEAVALGVAWCRAGADVDTRGALTLETDGAPASVFVDLDRRVGACS